MAGLPSMPNIPGGGARAQKAAALKAELEAKAAAAAEKVTGAEYHHVKPGDTLETIAQQYGQVPGAIWDHPLNKQLRERLGTPEGLAPGDGVYVPTVEQAPDTGPVGQGEYTVQSADCISSIAKNTGHFWKTIWEDGQNSQVREVRKEPNVLLAGDRLHIPEIRKKQEPGETEMRHRFVRRGEPAALRMQILIEDEPVGDAPYILKIDGETIEGFTDTDGWVDTAIPGNARQGRLQVVWEGTMLVYALNLGRIEPVETTRGVQQRLKNLGFKIGKLDGNCGPRTKAAVMKYQHSRSLPNKTGEVDAATQAKLKEEHGS